MSIFTPDDEPYLGRRSLHEFDKIIIECMAANRSVSRCTHSVDKSELQLAACKLIPASLSLGLSTRELIRQGYLYGALVMQRPFMERIVTLVYLRKFPETLVIWKRGWKYRERPSLRKMLEKIGDSDFPGSGSEAFALLNSAVHGDPASSIWNTIEMTNGKMGHPVSKMLDRPDLCDLVCNFANTTMTLNFAMMHVIFPCGSHASTNPE